MATTSSEIKTGEEIFRFIACKVFETFDVSRPEERNEFLRYLEEVRKVLIPGATVLDTSNRIPAMATTSSESGTIGNERIPSDDRLSAFKSFPTFDVSRPEDESGMKQFYFISILMFLKSRVR